MIPKKGACLAYFFSSTKKDAWQKAVQNSKDKIFLLLSSDQAAKNSFNCNMQASMCCQLISADINSCLSGMFFWVGRHVFWDYQACFLGSSDMFFGIWSDLILQRSAILIYICSNYHWNTKTLPWFSLLDYP